ncbi:F-box protein [Forsythia ovata]|uniref:F-box protein n=1 Tax=Forsythia ovata TaxID=205694 RepID=A0ABD1W8Z2_9LAMI
MNVHEDVLLEILLRLPPKSVFRSRCVSKRWNQIINDSFFLNSYAERRKGPYDAGRLLAIIRCPNGISSPIEIVPPLDNQIGTIPRELGDFICSSNGLILCVRLSSNGHFFCCLNDVTYTVLNPLTKKWVSLPSPANVNLGILMGLVCEENTAQLVANYKVVHICNSIWQNELMIETYSSKTGKWIESKLFTTDYFRSRLFGAPLVLNGIFHWTVSDVFMAIYDPNDIGGENHLQLIEMPHTEARSYSTGFSRSSDGLLWYGENNIRQIMKFWMLPKGENGYRRSCTIPRQEWSLVHTVNLDSLCDNYSIISHVRTCMQDYYDLYMIALNPKNPLIVLFSICGTTFVCNIESKSMEPVQYHEPSTEDHICFYNLYPYFESPFLSSYALQ